MAKDIPAYTDKIKDDRGKRSDSLKKDLKDAFQSKATGPRKRSKEEGVKVTQIMGFLGLPQEHNVVKLPPEPKQGKEPPEGASYAVKDPDQPIEIDAELRPGDTDANEEHWGYHLVVDIADGNENIGKHKAIAEFLASMVVELKMRPIGKPIVLDITGQEGRGVTGVQILTTSHISIHTDDDKWTAYIDVFSCAPYDHKIALKHIEKTFKPKHMGYVWLYRDAGKWPHKKK